MSTAQGAALRKSVQTEQQCSSCEANEIIGKVAMISSVVATAMPEEKPFDFQADFLNDHVTRYIAKEKARQVGESRTAAQKETILCIAQPNHLAIFCSMSLDDAREKILYAKELYDILSEKTKTPTIITDSRLELGFSNGSRILSVFTPRGKRGAHIYLDEFAHSQDPRKLWTATIPIMIHKISRLKVMSSPLHSMTWFNDIMTRKDGKYGNFVLQKTYWWDCPLHCHDVDSARASILDPKTQERLINTPDAVSEFGTVELQEIYEGMPEDDFKQEMELEKVDDSTALLSWELIMRCTPTGEQAVERFETIQELLQKIRGRQAYAGYDVGRHHDTGELTVFLEEDGVAVERFVMSNENVKFSVQEEQLHALMEIPEIRRMEIDSTAIGEQLGESLQEKWGETRIGCMKFTAPSCSTMATNLKMNMERTVPTVRFLHDRRRMMHMHSIKKKVTATGITYQVDRAGTDPSTKRHHGDVFWSRALGLIARAHAVGAGSPRIRSLGGEEVN